MNYDAVDQTVSNKHVRELPLPARIIDQMLSDETVNHGALWLLARNGVSYSFLQTSTSKITK